MKTSVAERLRNIMQSQGITQQYILNKCDELGVPISSSTLSYYISGQRTPKLDKIKVLADVLNVSIDELLGNNIIKDKLYESKGIPLLGEIACGKPILAQENIEEYIIPPATIHCDFALRCVGDSMIEANIHNNDIVFVKEQQAVENGEIAVVLIENMENDATLKRFYKKDNAIILKPENKDYEPLMFIGEDMSLVSILGKAVYYITKVE